MSADSLPPRWGELTALQRDALVGVCRLQEANERRYGLAVERAIEEWYGTAVSADRLAGALTALVEANLLERKRLDQQTNEYALTTEGRRLLRRYGRFLTGLVDDSETR